MPSHNVWKNALKTHQTFHKHTAYIQSVTKYSLQNIKPRLIQCKNALKCKCIFTFWSSWVKIFMLIFEVYSWFETFYELRGQSVFFYIWDCSRWGKKRNGRTDCNTEQHVAELLYLVTDTKTPSVTLHPPLSSDPESSQVSLCFVIPPSALFTAGTINTV